MSRYSTEYVLSVSDVDVNYRMNMVAVSLYFQDCLARYMAINHLSPFDLSQQNLYWAMTGIEMQMVGERPFWMEKIQVEIWFCEYSAVREYVNFKMSVKDKVFVEGTSSWVILDKTTRRPIDAGDFMNRTAIVGEGRPHRIRNCSVPDDAQLIEVTRHHINNNDVDFNGHMSNRNYLGLAMSSMPRSHAEGTYPKSVCIQFRKESFLGETLSSALYQSKEDSCHFWNTINDVQSQPVCSVDMEMMSGVKEADIAEEIDRRMI